MSAFPVSVSLPSLSYVSTMYSTMAPDSHRIKSLLLWSLMAGSRPLGLMAVKDASLGLSMVILEMVSHDAPRVNMYIQQSASPFHKGFQAPRERSEP